MVPSLSTEQKTEPNGTIPFLEFFQTEHGVGTVPFPRNGTIPFRPPRFQNRTHPKCLQRFLKNGPVFIKFQSTGPSCL